MSATTDKLIASLSATASPLAPAQSPLVLYGKWLAGVAIYLCALVLVLGLRDDLALRLHAPLFLAEIGFLTGIILTCGMSAVMLTYPDMHQKRSLVWLPAVPLTFFICVLYWSWTVNKLAPMPVHGIECLMCIVFCSAIPAVGILYHLRKQASVHPHISGAVALLSASSIGCLALRLSEKTDSIAHLVQWHYLPLFGFGTVGVIIGRKILKW